MAEEQDIINQLTAKFPFLQDTFVNPRPRRLFVPLTSQQGREVFDFAVKEMDFDILCTITGLDTGETLTAIYHLARNSGVMLNLQVAVGKDNPVLATVSDAFPAADAYERELIDLLGFVITGLPEGPRYPLPDDFPKDQHPLRKEWTADMLKQPSGAKVNP